MAMLKPIFPGGLGVYACSLWASFRNVPEEGAQLVKRKGGQELGGEMGRGWSESRDFQL